MTFLNEFESIIEILSLYGYYNNANRLLKQC